ncbi:cache domain-containing sensor histidine kinase [Gorillibacterium sp. sgz5001074]|uniref:cache domain-containing sensor histidine kinase n=1 Tax=Gorillibacterium sp. sgz5001074 TaxID=3446695 RepID=UPI003F664D2E
MRLRLQNLLYSLSFKHRILVSFVLLITLAISAAGSISYLIASKEIQNNAFEASQETVNKSAQMMEDRLNLVTVAVRSLMFSDAFEKMMEDVQSMDFTKYYRHLSAMQSVFSSVSYNAPLIQNILIATPIGDFYPTTEYRVQDQSFYDSYHYDLIKAHPNGVWMKGHADPFFTGGQRVLSFVTQGISIKVSDYPLNVFVVVNVKENELARLLGQGVGNRGRYDIFIDSDGEQVVQNDWSAKHGLDRDETFRQQVSPGRQGSFFHNFGEGDYLVNYAKLSSVPDWVLLGMQSKELLLERVNGIKRTTLWVILGFVLTSWLLSNRLTALLLRPLLKLQGLMRKVENNQLDVRFTSRFQDEVAQVGYQFNRMLDEINRLIDNVKRSETTKRKAELKALTAQMEPHFLYNTLNTIYCKSVLGENQDVNEMILALSQMFQLGLSGGRDLIPLEDELQHVRMYCAIQMKCYEGLFEYEVEVEDEELLACYVPKILLQPLVENTILHGFKDRKSGGRILIRAEAEDGVLVLTVEDNGTGFDPARVLAGMDRPTESKKGYALKNIRNRLQVNFGADAGMELVPQPETGSRIVLRLPQLEGEQESNGEAL